MKNFKYIFTLALTFSLVLFFQREVNASHYSAGEIFYEWIGDEPGHGPLDYRVYATIYRNIGGIDIGTANLDACLFRASNRSGATSFQLNYISPFAPLPSKYTFTQNDPYGWRDTGPHPSPDDQYGWQLFIPQDECADANKDVAEYRYAGEVTLPSKASDWRFAIDPPSARDQNDNIATAPGFINDLYIEVNLNNTIGHNSSPRIIGPAAKSFCIVQAGQKPFKWSQAALEEDGDSLVYGFHTPGSQNGDCGSAPGTMIYQSVNNYQTSATDPIPSNPKSSINSSTGIYTIAPTTVGNFVIKIEVRDLRFDSSLVKYIEIGNTIRELQVPVAGNCKSNTQGGPKIDLSKPGITTRQYDDQQMDSLETTFQIVRIKGNDSSMAGGGNFIHNMAVYNNYNCLDDTLTLEFQNNVRCNTATPTDFRLIGPDGRPRPIAEIKTNCQFLNTRTIDLVLSEALDVNGEFLLQIRRGNDGNTLENECGFELTPFYSALIKVDGCPIPEYQLDNVTVLNDVNVRLDWSGNADLQDPRIEQQFDHWQILRNDKGNRPLQIVSKFSDSASARFFVDSLNNNGFYVDNVIYDYALLLVYNAKGRKQTRIINNIRLQDSSLSEDELFLDWNKYNGYTDSALSYDVYQGEVDTATNAISWQFVANTDTVSEYTHTKPDKPDPPADSIRAEKTYAMRVIAKNGGSAYQDSSQSNFIYFKRIHYPKDPVDPLGEVYVPNVITPNGDQLNDRFYISFKEGEAYDQISLEVYNRWGNMVFSDNNYGKRNSREKGWQGTGPGGERLPDGVYFYILKMNDARAAQTKSVQGQINIMGVGAN